MSVRCRPLPVHRANSVRLMPNGSTTRERATAPNSRSPQKPSPRRAPPVGSFSSRNGPRTILCAVYAKTFSKVTCKGEGAFACGYAITDGAAFANALARASAQAVVDASTEKADAFCYSDVSAVAGALANAAASARSAACVKGTGSEEDFQEAFVESVSQAYANAFASAVAKSCSGMTDPLSTRRLHITCLS